MRAVAGNVRLLLSVHSRGLTLDTIALEIGVVVAAHAAEKMNPRGAGGVMGRKGCCRPAFL